MEFVSEERKDDDSLFRCFVRSLFDNPLFAWMTFFWGLSKIVQWIVGSEVTIWESVWRVILDIFGDDEFDLYVFGTGTLSIFTIVSVSSCYLFMDIFMEPKSLRKYKVQLHTNEPLDMRKFAKAILLIIFNQIFVSVPFAFGFYYIMRWRGIPNLGAVENFPEAIFNVYVCSLTYEVCFYLSHRLLHHKALYRNVHKVHHEWTASIAIIALYSHPLEHLLVNLGSVFMGIVLTGCHLATAWLWLGLLLCSTLGDHSGYHMPFLHSAEFHDYHHLMFNVNYGATGLMDQLFGTDKAFRQTINNVRHRTLTSMKSAREIFPDPITSKTE